MPLPHAVGSSLFPKVSSGPPMIVFVPRPSREGTFLKSPRDRYICSLVTDTLFPGAVRNGISAFC